MFFFYYLFCNISVSNESGRQIDVFKDFADKRLDKDISKDTSP